MINEITAWLNSGMDYTQGCLLYMQYGHSASQKRIFHVGGPTARNRSALEYELRKMIKGKAPEPAVIRKANPVATPKPKQQKKKKPARSSKKAKGKSKGGQTPRKPKPSKMK